MQEKISKEDLHKEKILRFLNEMPFAELSYTIGRYCGPSNQVLCEKKYGFTIPHDLAIEIYKTRQFEEDIFGPETE